MDNVVGGWISRHRVWSTVIGAVLAIAAVATVVLVRGSGSAAVPAVSDGPAPQAEPVKTAVVVEARMSVLHLDNNEVLVVLQGTQVKMGDGRNVTITKASEKPIQGQSVRGSAPRVEPFENGNGADGTLLEAVPLQVGDARILVEPDSVQVITHRMNGSYMTLIVEITDKDGKAVQGRIPDVDQDAFGAHRIRYRQG